MNRIILVAFLFTLAACGPRELHPDEDFECSNCEEWNESIEPFRVFGNTWFVGVDGLTALLIETSDGLVLVDGGLPQSAAKIDENIRSLGFDPQNIRAILVSHTHFDHAGGVNALQRLSGAVVYTSERGVESLQTGTLPEDDPQFGYGPEKTSFPASRNVEALADGAAVTVGDVEITAVYTPGHTPGSVSWTWESCALGTCNDIVYADSLTPVSAPGFRYSDGAAADIIESAGKVSALDCDILLSPHPFFFGMHEKLELRDDGNPFVNDVACMIYGENTLDWLQQRLDSEGN